MPKFFVACFSPPAGFSVNRGDTVKVNGWRRAEIIKATSVITNGREWIMGGVPKTLAEAKLDFPKTATGVKQKIEQVTKTGVVSNVVNIANAVQFELSCI